MHSHMRKQRIILKDKTHTALFRIQPFMPILYLLVMQIDLPVINGDQSGDRFQQGGLATATRAEQRQYFPFFQNKGDILQNSLFLIAALQVVNFNGVHVIPRSSERLKKISGNNPTSTIISAGKAPSCNCSVLTY